VSQREIVEDERPGRSVGNVDSGIAAVERVGPAVEAIGAVGIVEL
jgi:hypothetical protein